MGTGFERGVMANRRSEGGKKKEKKKEVAGDDDWGRLREAEGRGQPFDDGTECGDAGKQEREQLIGQMGLEVGTKTETEGSKCCQSRGYAGGTCAPRFAWCAW